MKLPAILALLALCGAPVAANDRVPFFDQTQCFCMIVGPGIEDAAIGTFGSFRGEFVEFNVLTSFSEPSIRPEGETVEVESRFAPSFGPEQRFLGIWWKQQHGTAFFPLDGETLRFIGTGDSEYNGTKLGIGCTHDIPVVDVASLIVDATEVECSMSVEREFGIARQRADSGCGVGHAESLLGLVVAAAFAGRRRALPRI